MSGIHANIETSHNLIALGILRLKLLMRSKFLIIYN